MMILFYFTAVITLVLAAMVFRAKKLGRFDDGILIAAGIAVILGFLQITVPLLTDFQASERTKTAAVENERELIQEMVLELASLEEAIGETFRSYQTATAENTEENTSFFETDFMYRVPILFDQQRSLIDINPPYRDILRVYIATWPNLLFDTYLLDLEKAAEAQKKLEALMDETIKFRTELQEALNANRA